jgi:ankyrin repeat protein
MGTRACTVACVAAAAPDLRTLAGWLAGQNGWTSLMWASESGHVEAVRVLIEKGALIEAADKVRIHSHATTRALSQTLIHPSYTPGY